MKKYFQVLLGFVLSIMPLINWAYSVDQGRIYTDKKELIKLRGINWFGFETKDHVVHGLWARPWQSMIGQMKTLGFNAVRLPVCPETLQGVSVSSINYSYNPDLIGKNSLQILDVIIKEFDKQGFFIVLDHHNPDCQAISELWYTNIYSESQWIKDLTFIAKRYQNLPRFLGIDLKNEPHGVASWGNQSPKTDWNKAAEKAAAAILAVNSKLLIYVDGIQESRECSSRDGHWWGGNFEPLKCYPLNIPQNKLVLSPHVYGPDVNNHTYFNANEFPANLPTIWNKHFGQFAKQGYTINVGEFGGKFGHGGLAKDKIWQQAFVNYLLKNKLTDGFYWAWNPNSSDTGGILQNDWLTPWQDKMDLLLTLWRRKAACSDGLDNDNDGLIDYPNDPGCISVLDHNEFNQNTSIAACSDKIDNDNDGVIDYPSDLGCSSIIDNDEFNAPSSLKTSVIINSDWGAGYCAEVNVKNQGTQAEIWKVSIEIEGQINSLWNASYVQKGKIITAQGLDWNNVVQPNSEVKFGFCSQRQ